MIYGRNIFDQPKKYDQITDDNITNFVTGQLDDCTNRSLLDYFYFKENYN